ncbi:MULTISPECIES: universal stress protein [Prochlorococcus]|uniref:universal stress protein n=1 Tax=Prochlorococcus TaxID=1218 RepID=UPI0007B33515|nr:universal stress protein [Prochlorococcus marinus]KZR79168.1 Universal stress protein family protein [Prochlorococcus marinus str. MIT 1327]
MFETVLFPIDQSREAMETASKALELARSHNSRLIILSVVQAEQPEMHDPEAVAVLLKRAREQVEQAGIACEVLEREGKPAFVICDVADELNVDVIVMGTRGVNLDGDSESTAARVIQLAPCPVLVVP